MSVFAGVELDGTTARLAVVSLEPGGLGVVASREIQAADRETLVAGLQAARKEIAGFPRRVAASVSWQGLFQGDHLLGEFPIVKPHVLEKLVESQFRAENRGLDWKKVEFSAARLPGTAKTIGRVVGATIPTAIADDAYTVLRDAGLKPTRIVTPAVALCHLGNWLRRNNPLPDGTVSAILHVGQQKLTLVVTLDGEPVFVRESEGGEGLQPGGSGVSAGSDTGYIMVRQSRNDWAQQQVREISGSLRYVAQTFRFEVAHLFVSGPSARMGALATALEGDLSIPVETIKRGITGSMEADPGSPLPALGVAIGAATSLDSPRGVNLVPRARREAVQANFAAAISVAATIALVTAGVVASGSLEREAEDLGMQAQAAERLADSYQPHIERRRADEANRNRKSLVEAAARSKDSSIRGLEAAVVHLVRSCPPELAIEQLGFVSLQGGGAISVRGTMRGKDVDRLAEAFRALEAEIKAVPGWTEIKVSHGPPGPDNPDEGQGSSMPLQGARSTGGPPMIRGGASGPVIGGRPGGARFGFRFDVKIEALVQGWQPGNVTAARAAFGGSPQLRATAPGTGESR